MKIDNYIAPGRCVILKTQDKKKALAALARRIARETPGQIGFNSILAAVLDREHSISTRVSAALAMPHARIPEMDNTIAAVGVSREGVKYDPSQNGRVFVIVMIVGNDDNHLQALAAIADAFSKPGIMEKLRNCRTGRAVYKTLAGEEEKQHREQQIGTRSKLVLKQGLALARKVNAGTVLLYSEAPVENDPEITELFDRPFVRVFTNSIQSENTPPPGLSHPARLLELPFPGVTPQSRINLTLLLALTQGYIKKDERVVNILGSENMSELNTITLSDMAGMFRLFFAKRGRRHLFNINHSVLIRSLQVAAELADEGREGKAIGALFVIGDENAVEPHSQQMVMNPFKGYDESERNIMDPGLAETIKEFSNLDGAILIRNDGVIISAGTYLRAGNADTDVPPGLGARHAAAAGISAATDAMAIVVSQSTRKVSLFRAGKRIMML